MAHTDDRDPSPARSHQADEAFGVGIGFGVRSTGLEIPEYYGDNPTTTSSPDDGEYGVTAAPKVVPARILWGRGKVIVGVCCLFALSIIFGHGSSSSNSQEMSANTAGGSSVSIIPVGVRGTPPKEVPETPTEPEEDECKDDPDFVFSNLEHCEDFVAHVGRKPLHEARCHLPTGVFDANGEELLAKHFCRYNCGLCGDTEWVEFTKQWESEQEKEKSANVDNDQGSRRR